MTRARLALALAAGLLGLALPAGAARLEVSPPRVKVSPDEGATVRLRLDAQDATGAPREGLAFLAESNFGSVGSVSETAPGRYEASLKLPPTDMPRAALVVFSAQDAEAIQLHHAVVPVTVSTYLRARTEPRSKVTITAGGREFGPAVAGRAGWFTLAFDQPPGTESAEVYIVDSAGNVKRSTIPVPVRPHDALTVTLDRYRVASDGLGRVRVHALVFDRLGRPVKGARVEATADRGRLGDFVDHGDGVHGAEWFAPADGREGVATLRLRVREGGRLHEEAERVSIIRGPAGRLVLSADPTELVAGELREVALSARVLDAAGNGLAGERIRLTTDRGSVEEATDLGDGRYSSRLRVPEDVGSGSIEVKALLVQGEPERPPARIAVTANPEVVPTSWRAFSLVTATVTDAAGAPVAGEVVLFHVAHGEGVVTPAAVTNAAGRAFADFSADLTEEVVAVEAIATSVPSLKGETRIEKRASGEFAIINRPARAARGGGGEAVYEFDDEHRVLQDTALITIRPGEPASLVASAEPSTLIADGRSTSRITAVLKDARGNDVPGKQLRFGVDAGTVSEGSNSSDGRYTATYTAPSGMGDGRAVVTVTEPGSGLTATAAITLEVGPPARIALVADRDQMPADGRSEAFLTATVEDASGRPVPEALVRFVAAGAEAELTPSAVTDGRGRAEARLTAGLESGPLSVSAETGEGLSASVALELLPTEPVELVLAAAPESILANGAERSELSTELLDALGQPVADHEVEFRVMSGPGDLSATIVRSDALGLARAWLSGTEPGTATVRARSLRLPSLSDEIDVQLRPAALVASFTAAEPACEGGVLLSSTSDPELKHEWDWTGDGQPDAVGPTALAELPAGDTVVRLRVADDSGQEAASEQILTVLPSPNAVLSASAGAVAGGGSVRLDASASTAGGSGPLSFAWDLDGDGALDPGVEGPVVPAWRQDDGRRAARVVVTEASGCSAEARVEVEFGDVPVLVVSAATPGLSLPMPAGTAFRLETSWGNTGRATAPGTTVEIQLPAELSLAGALPAGGLELGGGRLRFPLGDVAAGSDGRLDLDLVATNEPALPSSFAQVTASIRHAIPGGQSVPVEAGLSLPIVPAVDLALACSAPATGKPGESFFVDLSLANDGASTAHDVALDLDWRSDQLELVAGSPAGSASPGRLRLDWVTLGAGEAVAARLEFRARSVLPAADNAARIGAIASHAGVDLNPGQEDCAPVVDVPAAPDAWVTVRALPERNPARPGDTVLFELEYGNRGSTAAMSSVVEGRFDTGLFESSLVDNPDAGIFSAAAGKIRFLTGRLAADPGLVRQARFRARIGADLPGGASIVGTEVEISHAEPDAEPADDRDSTTFTVQSAPDVGLAVSAPASLDAGETGSVLLTVSSTGDVPAEDVTVEHRLSGADGRILAASLPSFATLLPDGNVRFAFGDLAVGATQTVRYDLRASSLQPAVDPVLVNDWTASFGGAGAPGTSSRQVLLPIDADAELELELSLSAASAGAGESVQATLTLRSSGAAPRAAGLIDFGWDTSLFSAGPPDGTGFATLAPGDSALLGPWTLEARSVLPAAINDTVVTAALRGTSNSSAQPLRLRAAPALELRLSELPAAAAAGAWVDITLAYRNTGGTAASGTLLSLLEQAGNGGLVAEISPASRAVGSVPADGVERSAAFRARIAQQLPACSTAVTLEPRASFAEAPGSATGASASLDARGRPDLGLTVRMTPSRDPLGPDDFATFRFDLVNHGTAPALAPVLLFERDPAVLPDVLPPLPPAASWDATSVTIPLADLAPAGSVSGSFRLRVASSLPAPSNTTTVGAQVREASCEALLIDNADPKTFTVGSVADLVVAMNLRTDPADLVAGGSIGATIFLSNTGNADADGVELVLDFPQELVGRVVDDGGAGSASAGSLAWSGLAVPAGEPPLVFEVSLDVADNLPGTGNLVNLLASASTTSPENNLGNNAAGATRTARGWADLCLELSALPDPQPATAAGRLEYSLSLRNDGTTTATGTVVTLDYDSLLLEAPGGAGPLAWMVGDLAPGAVVLLSETFQITSSIPGGTATAAATATATSPEHDAWNLAACDASDREETVITDQPDLALTKTISRRDPILLRTSLVEYTVTVENRGNADLDGGALPVGSVEDLVPSGLVVRTTGGGSWNGTVLRWDLPTQLRRGESWSVSYQVEIDPATPPGVHSLTNTARVLPAFPDATPSNDSDAITLEFRFDVDLVTSVTCTALPAPAVPGSLLEYEVVVDNIGSYDATGVGLTLDGGSELVYEAPLTGSGPVVVPGPRIPALGRWVYRFQARSQAAFPDPLTVVSLTATASCVEADADPANDASTTSCNVLSSTDMRTALTVTELDGTPPVQAGELLEITAISENVGTRIESDAFLVVEYDPALASFVSSPDLAPDGAGRARHDHGAPFDPREPSESHRMQLQVAPVLPTGLEVLEICSTISSPGPDIFPADNRACRQIQLFASPDLVLTRSATTPSSPAAPGQAISHELRVENRGSTAATNVVVRDRLDSERTTGLLPGSASHPATAGPGFVDLELGDLPAGEAFAVSYQVGIASSLTSIDDSIASEACATSDEADANASDNCGSLAVPVEALPDATISLRAEPASGLAAGAAVTAFITYGNDGSSPLVNPSLRLDLDPSVLVADGSGGTGPGPWLLTGLPDLAPGDSREEVVPLQLADTLPQVANSLELTATISHDAGARDANLPDTATASLNAAGEVDLVATLSLVSPADPQPGDLLVYEIGWRNDGSTTATGVTLELAPDALLSLPDGSPAPNPETRALADLAPGASGSARESYLLAGAMPQDLTTISLRALLAAAEPEREPADNTAWVGHQITASPDLGVSGLGLVAAPAPAGCGSTLTVTAEHDNHGTSTARGTSLVFTFDDSVAGLIDAGGGMPDGGNRVVFDLGDRPADPGATSASTIVLQAHAVQGGLSNPLVVSAEISASNEPLAAQGDNAAVQFPVIQAEPDLVVEVRHDASNPDPAEAGGTVTLTASISNQGCTRAEQVLLQLAWDPALVASIADDGGASGTDASSAEWSLGTLAPGAPPVERTIVLRVAPLLPTSSNTMVVDATGTSVDSDGDPANNTASVQVELLGDVDLVLSAAVQPPGPLGSGSFVFYTYTVSNIGTTAAQDACVRSAYDNQVLSHWIGGTDEGAVVEVCVPGSLAPGDPPAVRTAMFQVIEPGTGEIRRDLGRLHEAAETGKTVADDRNPADNVASTSLTACFLDVRITSPSPATMCLDSSITLVAEASVATGISYEWIAVNGGTFDDPTARVVTFTPPPAAGLYPVHLRVTHESGCTATTETNSQQFPVRVVGDCNSCGCHPANLKLTYVDGTLERLDQPGNRAAARGETVAFRLRVTDSGTGKSAIIRNGTTLSFADGQGHRYSAQLAYPIFYECRTDVLLTFNAAQVPADMALGNLTPELLVDSIDACGNGSPRNTNLTDDVTILAPLTGGLDPGVSFSDWGPERIGR